MEYTVHTRRPSGGGLIGGDSTTAETLPRAQ